MLVPFEVTICDFKIDPATEPVTVRDQSGQVFAVRTQALPSGKRGRNGLRPWQTDARRMRREFPVTSLQLAVADSREGSQTSETG